MTLPNSIQISLQLEVIANNKVVIPGCEPTSALTSKTLNALYAKDIGCKNALVDVKAILDNIPGSYLKFGTNFNKKGIRQRWVVLPPFYSVCPCETYPDYYAWLKELATDEMPVEDKYDTCDMEGMGYCPSPGFIDYPTPPKDPYVAEGTFPGDAGILPPIPPWGNTI